MHRVLYDAHRFRSGAGDASAVVFDFTADARRELDAVGDPFQRTEPAAADANALCMALYADLCRLARREVRRNGAVGILSTHTLVHEAWLDISRRPALSFDSAGRFLAYASRAMRGLVINRVCAQHAHKRGGLFIITSLDTHNADQIAQPEALQKISDALEDLASLEPELARVVDLKFFCGFTLAEVARMQGISERTVRRQWSRARMMLYKVLDER